MNLPKSSLQAITEFCINQRECCFCPFFNNMKFVCKIKDENRKIPEEWEVKDELERMD